MRTVKHSRANAAWISMLVFAMLVGAFQNCSGANLFQSGSGSQMEAGGGGGHSYDGKPYVAYGTCPDGTRVTTRILLLSDVTATVQRENCAEIQPRSIGPSEFKFDPARPDQLEFAGVVLVAEPIPTPPALLSKGYLQFNGVLHSYAQPMTYFVDYKDQRSTEIQTLHAAGHTVICMANAGAVSSVYDPDYASFAPSDIGNASAGSERWLDTRSANVRAVMMRRLDYAHNIGCDGMFWDQTDGYLNNNGFALTLENELDYINYLVAATRARKMLVALSNMSWLSADLVGLFDMQYSENCYQSNKCDSFQSFVTAGKPVFISESGAFSQALCDQAKASGYTLWFTSPTQDGSRDEQCP